MTNGTETPIWFHFFRPPQSLPSSLEMVDRRKRTFVSIPSSSSSSSEIDRSGGEEDYSVDDVAFEHGHGDGDDSDYFRSSNSSGGEDDSSDVDYADEVEDAATDDSGGGDSDDDRVEDYGTSDGDDEEVVCNRIAGLLRERKVLQGLRLEDCKTYLRRHGLRISGTKDVCLRRIQEHWRIKDGKGEALYPRSSFTINCTGDVCRGDIVLFTQKVYDKFDKMTRNGRLLGKRTVAGRVVKESYGAAKQQHTFTVEVLWSRGAKRLSPLFPLLVKGRNLYKMRTFRQPWENEAARSEVLAEKHKRGVVARQVRAVRRERGPTTRGAKRQKLTTHSVRPTHQMNHSQRSNNMQVEGKGGAPSSSFSTGCHHKKSQIGYAKPAKGAEPEPGPSMLYQQHNQNFSMQQKVSNFQAPHRRPHVSLQNGSNFAASLPMRFPPEMDYPGLMMIHPTESYGFNQELSRSNRPTHRRNHSVRGNSKRLGGGQAASSRCLTGDHHQKAKTAKHPSARPAIGAEPFNLYQQNQQHFPNRWDPMLHKAHNFQAAHHRPLFPPANGITFASSHPGSGMVTSTGCYGFAQTLLPVAHMNPSRPAVFPSGSNAISERSFHI